MFDWEKIDTVLLDMDGTLLDLHFDNYFWHEHLPIHWAEKNKLELDEAKAELFPIFKQQEGTLAWYCLDYWSERLDVNIMQLKEEITHKIQMRPDTKEFLEFLKQEKKHVVMVTNAHPDLITMKFVATNIDVFFQDVISSHSLGVAKEEVQFWKSLEEKIDYNKDRSILIDDNLNVLKSAEEYGLGYLLSIIQPDSQAPKRMIENFSAIHNFSEIMPD